MITTASVSMSIHNISIDTINNISSGSWISKKWEKSSKDIGVADYAGFLPAKTPKNFIQSPIDSNDIIDSNH
jgi:hypothetical protein